MDKVYRANEFISKELWFDFEVESFDGGTLIIKGGIDLYYGWSIKLIFSTVVFISLKSDWMKNDTLKFIEILTGPKEASIKELNLIEKSSLIFGLNHRDVSLDKANQFIIAADEFDCQFYVKNA